MNFLIRLLGFLGFWASLVVFFVAFYFLLEEGDPLLFNVTVANFFMAFSFRDYVFFFSLEEEEFDCH